MFENSILIRSILLKSRHVFVGALAVVVGLAYGASVQAQSSLSANVKLTSNYAFQGASDSDGLPAFQGGFDWSHSSGPYVGIWVSNVASASGEGVGGIELDYYAGYATSLTDKIGVNLGVFYIHYPEGDSNTSVWDSFVQPKVAVSFDAGFASFGASYRRAFTDNPQNRTVLSASVPLGKIPATFSGKFGINDYENNEEGNDYYWFQVGIGTEIKDYFGINFFYTDRDTAGSDGIVGASISRSFNFF